MKKTRSKKKLLKQLCITPIVQVACEKSDVSRATYYRWRHEDPEFAKDADKALGDGSLLINDMAESQLISAIRDKNIHAIRLWLQNHHPTYASKLEISGKLQVEQEPTEEEEKLIRQALSLSKLTLREYGKESNKGDA